MSRRLLENLFAALVVGLIVWPVPHYLITQHIHSDPWKNMGLAMYATYYQLGVHVRVQGPGGQWLDLSSTPNAEALIGAFAERRRTRGTWLRPDELAKELKADSGASALRILVMTHQLDGAQGKMRVVDREIYEYP